MSTNNNLLKMESINAAVFHKVLDGMKAGIYITDMDTDEIIYMNVYMKKDFQIENPEGRICWQVLQKGQKERCTFCPIKRLRKHQDTDFVYQWDEINSVTLHSYRNYDSLITWSDGRIVHLQQSIDVTELKSANTDELTQFFSRRYGKEVLKATIEKAKAAKQILSVALYDINYLKNINDMYGHAEGDQVIVKIADAVRAHLQKDEYAFRLSGDEFVVILFCDQWESKQRMEMILKLLQQQEQITDLNFSYGIAEITPEMSFTADEVLFLADKRMYEQKRHFHIEHHQKKLNTYVTQTEYFSFDKERLYDALVQSTDDYIYVCNMKTGIFKYTKAMVEEFDLPSQVIDNASVIWGNKVHPADRMAFLESNQEISDGRATSHCVEYRAKNRKGQWIWVRCRGHLELDENKEPLLFAGFITNLGKRNKIDGLTGLSNKLEFEDQIVHLIDQKQTFSVMILGIDDLKHINDLYNRFFGDEVIRITSQRMQSLLPEGAVLYHLDGDEFGILIRKGDHQIMESLYKAIYHSFENQQTYEGKKYYCTLSGGGLLCPQDANTYDSIIKYAHYCLEYSKNHGKKQFTYYAEHILDQRARSLEMVELLRESVENNFHGFHLLYQPLVKADDGSLLGVEALARWECKRFGSVSPVEFIPLLESTGLIVEVGKWILKTAVQACKSWVMINPDFVIDVNLSYVQIKESDFLSYLQEVIEVESFASRNLVMEVTESHFMKENTKINELFSQMRSMGIKIAMDDFGTGYSTLGILKEAPADIVKIDKTFIRNIGDSNFDATFIRFVVELCHDVGIKVCLEGVETNDTYQIVSSMGLDLIQGYLFDKPLSQQAFTEKYFSMI